MKNSVKLGLIIAISLLVGVLIGWSLPDKRGVELDREILVNVLKQHERVKNATIHIDDETRNLYYKINNVLANHPTKAGDSIADILHHTSAVMNKYLSMNDLIRDVYRTDSAILKQHFKPE